MLNQLIIPVTMVGAYALLKSRFESFQIWGSAFILLGAVVASSNYLFRSSPTADLSTNTDGTDSSPPDAAATAMVSAAVILYIISVIPSALSNIYKDGKMKEQDMNEVHTSTIVAFWQLWCSFLFLPLMSLPALGKIAYYDFFLRYIRCYFAIGFSIATHFHMLVFLHLILLRRVKLQRNGHAAERWLDLLQRHQSERF